MDIDAIILLAKKKVLLELISEIENIELPPDWKSRDSFRFVLNKIKEKEKTL
jgi:hypothetical protein